MILFLYFLGKAFDENFKTIYSLIEVPLELKKKFDLCSLWMTWSHANCSKCKNNMI